MAQIVNHPEYVGTLTTALEERFAGATTDVQRIRGLDTYAYRIAVLWEPFADVPVMERHDLAWEVARKVLNREQKLRISMILCLTTRELRGED